MLTCAYNVGLCMQRFSMCAGLNHMCCTTLVAQQASTQLDEAQCMLLGHLRHCTGGQVQRKGQLQWYNWSVLLQHIQIHVLAVCYLSLGMSRHIHSSSTGMPRTMCAGTLARAMTAYHACTWLTARAPLTSCWIPGGPNICRILMSFGDLAAS